jgi:hypothetical protein
VDLGRAEGREEKDHTGENTSKGGNTKELKECQNC